MNAGPLVPVKPALSGLQEVLRVHSRCEVRLVSWTDHDVSDALARRQYITTQISMEARRRTDHTDTERQQWLTMERGRGTGRVNRTIDRRFSTSAISTHSGPWSSRA